MKKALALVSAILLSTVGSVQARSGQDSDLAETFHEAVSARTELKADLVELARDQDPRVMMLIEKGGASWLGGMILVDDAEYLTFTTCTPADCSSFLLTAAYREGEETHLKIHGSEIGAEPIILSKAKNAGNGIREALRKMN